MATLYNSITCELEAGTLDFICALFFSMGGYVTALTFLTFKFFNPPTLPQKIFVIVPNNLHHSFDSPVGCTGKCFYGSLTSLPGLFVTRHFSPFEHHHAALHPAPSSALEPGTSCAVELTVTSLICAALRVRSRLRLSLQHWADLSGLQPAGTDSVYTPLL